MAGVESGACHKRWMGRQNHKSPARGWEGSIRGDAKQPGRRVAAKKRSCEEIGIPRSRMARPKKRLTSYSQQQKPFNLRFISITPYNVCHMEWLSVCCSSRVAWRIARLASGGAYPIPRASSPTPPPVQRGHVAPRRDARYGPRSLLPSGARNNGRHTVNSSTQTAPAGRTES